MVADRQLGGLPPDGRPMSCATASPVSPPTSGFNEPTIATLLGHNAHSITSRYVDSADAVLLAAADAVANATMKLTDENVALMSEPVCREAG